MHAGGRGRGDFDDRPPPTFAPDREALLGSAARPGEVHTFQSADETAALAERTFNKYPEALQVPHPCMCAHSQMNPIFAAASPRFVTMHIIIKLLILQSR
jgi:hypothetical protein